MDSIARQKHRMSDCARSCCIKGCL